MSMMIETHCHGGFAMKLFAPADIHSFGIASPDDLRDWRRRGFLDGIGLLPTKNGGWTSNLNDPDLLVTGRPTWAYHRRDVLALAIGLSLIELKIDRSAAFRVGSDLVLDTIFYIEGQPRGRFAIAYAQGRGPNHQGSASPLIAGILANVKTLEEVGDYFRSPAAVLIDLKAVIATFPPELITALEYR